MANVSRRDTLRSLGLAAAALAPAATARAAPAPAAGAGKMVSLQELRLYVARPKGPSKAGILLQPRINGLEPTMTRFADEFAAAGFTAVVWDPYNGESVEHAPQLQQLERSKLLEDHKVVADLKRCVDYMQAELKLTSIGVIGWCLGGRYVFLHAANDPRVKAVVAYNPSIYQVAEFKIGPAPIKRADFKGQTLNEYDEAARIACPVQVLRPGLDNLMLPGEYEHLNRVLFAREAPTQFQMYPKAEHGFQYTTEKPNNAAAAKISWPSTMAFFKSTLEG